MLSELFKTEERVKILRYIMSRSIFSVSEVSLAAKVNRGLVSRYLRLLVELGLVQRLGRKYSFLDNARTQAIRLLLNLEKLDLSTLSLGPEKSLGLYGSWASGTNRLDSDLDVWIKTDSLTDERELARLQRDLSVQSGVEVNLLVLTPQS